MLLALLGPLAAGLIQAAISPLAGVRRRRLRCGSHRRSACPRRRVGQIEHAAQTRPLSAGAETGPVSSLMIANPFSGQAVMRLLSTHPDTAQRIARLRDMPRTQDHWSDQVSVDGVTASAW